MNLFIVSRAAAAAPTDHNNNSACILSSTLAFDMVFYWLHTIICSFQLHFNAAYQLTQVTCVKIQQEQSQLSQQTVLRVKWRWRACSTCRKYVSRKTSRSHCAESKKGARDVIPAEGVNSNGSWLLLTESFNQISAPTAVESRHHNCCLHFARRSNSTILSIFIHNNGNVENQIIVLYTNSITLTRTSTKARN